MTPDITWQPTGENILDLADQAVRTVFRSWYGTPDERVDAMQAAALTIWEAWQLHPDHKAGYYFGAARFRLYDWISENRIELSLHPMEWRLSQPDVEPPDERPDLDVECIRAYGQFSEHDIDYLHRACAGASVNAIAHAQGVTPSCVYMYRNRLLRRLERLAGVPVTPPRVYPQSPLNDAQLRQVADWRAVGVMWDEIGTRIERHPKAVKSAFRRWRKREMQQGAAA